MNHHFIIAAATIVLSACTQLSEQDRALLMETHSTAQAARDASIRAADSAAASAAEAKAASDRADRIFRQSQNK